MLLSSTRSSPSLEPPARLSIRLRTVCEQAADYYAGEDATTREGKCKNKVAKHSASLSRYDVAYRNFEELGSKALESNLLKFNAKKHFLHAGFCLLARGDVVASKQGVERYIEMDYTFRDSKLWRYLAVFGSAAALERRSHFRAELRGRAQKCAA